MAVGGPGVVSSCFGDNVSGGAKDGRSGYAGRCDEGKIVWTGLSGVSVGFVVGREVLRMVRATRAIPAELAALAVEAVVFLAIDVA